MRQQPNRFVHEAGDAEELAVLLDPPGGSVTADDARIGVRFVSELGANVGLVLKRRVDVDLVNARDVGGKAKMMAGVELPGLAVLKDKSIMKD